MSFSRKLDRRITIEQPSVSRDDYGGESLSWTTLGQYAASRNDVSDSEKYSADQVNSSIMARFVVRSTIKTRQVNSTYRLNHNSMTWEILGVKEVNDSRKRFIEITAKAQSD